MCTIPVFTLSRSYKGVLIYAGRWARFLEFSFIGDIILASFDLVRFDFYLGSLLESCATIWVPSTMLFAKDRKSTRLNSSHVSISYAVFCLKKKKRRSISTKTICDIRI